MAFELVYTSVERGLKPGSKGFCTVAFTEGMPANYIQIAESLSGYRSLYPPHDPNYSNNPVSISHLAFVVGGRSLHFLTRVAAFGTDYSGRDNKLSHSVILRNSDLHPSGPLNTALSSGFFRTSWSENPQVIKAEKKLSVADSPHGAKAEAWQQATGDAGWAGFLAQQFLQSPEKPAYLVFNPGMDMTALLGESIALIPPELRWKVTFSTYFISDVRGASCSWRCVLPNSPLLASARRSGFPVIDLTQNPGACSAAGPLVDAARTGGQPDWSSYQVEEKKLTSASEVNTGPTAAAKAIRCKAPSAEPKATSARHVRSNYSNSFPQVPEIPTLNKNTNPWVPIGAVGALVVVVVCLVLIILSPSGGKQIRDLGNETANNESTEAESKPLDDVDNQTDAGQSTEISEIVTNAMATSSEENEGPIEVVPVDDVNTQRQQKIRDIRYQLDQVLKNVDLSNVDRLRELLAIQSQLERLRDSNQTRNDDTRLMTLTDTIRESISDSKTAMQKSVLVFLEPDEPYNWSALSLDNQIPSFKFYEGSLQQIEKEKFRRDEIIRGEVVEESIGETYQLGIATVNEEPNKFSVRTRPQDFSLQGNKIRIIRAEGDNFQSVILFGPIYQEMTSTCTLKYRNESSWEIEVPEIIRNIIEAEGISVTCLPAAFLYSKKIFYKARLEYVGHSRRQNTIMYSFKLVLPQETRDEYGADYISLSKKHSPRRPAPTQPQQKDFGGVWETRWKQIDGTRDTRKKNEYLTELVAEVAKLPGSKDVDMSPAIAVFKRRLEKDDKEMFDKRYKPPFKISTLTELLKDKDYKSNSDTDSLAAAIRCKVVKKFYIAGNNKNIAAKQSPPPEEKPVEVKAFTPYKIRFDDDRSGNPILTLILKGEN